MENQLQIFESEEFGKIRTGLINGEPWFVGKDVATALSYADTFAALKQHVDDEDKMVLTRKQFEEMASDQKTGKTPVLDFEFDSPRGLTFINESGVYALIFGSNLPKAKEFKHYVTSEVLPSIRKYGYYIAPSLENAIKNMAQTLTSDSAELACLAERTPMLSLQMEAMMIKILADYTKNPNKLASVIEDLPGEIWKWIKNYEGVYQVSTISRVRNFHRGNVTLMTPHPTEDGHMHIGLYKDGKTITYSIHRLVAEAFIPNPDNLPEVDHRDGNPANNHVTNLRWCTRKQNAEYAVETGAYKFGDNHPRSKLTVEKVREIRAKYVPHSKTCGIKALARDYDVSKSTIEHVVYNEIWKHVQ